MNIPINNNQEILDNFKIIINEIQNKNLELSNLIESLNKQILEKDIIINDLNKLNQEFKNQLNEFKLKRDLLEDEILKEKKLIETKIKTSNLTLEIQYQNKIEEILTLNEKDKKKFYNLITNNFYEYYDPSLSFNYLTFEKLIEKVKNDFQIYKSQINSIKKLLCINDNESIDIHLSKLLIELYKR